MRKLGVILALVFLSVAAKGNAEEFPDPQIIVNTPSGTSVPVSLPAVPTPAPGQTYTATAKPIVVPVPITFQMTPNIVRRPAPAPVPAFPAQPPQPANQGSCAPIDPRAPLPEPPMDGPITSTVLPPPGYARPVDVPGSFQPQTPYRPDQSVNPLTGQPVAAPYPPGLYAPRQGVYSDPVVPAPAPVPGPGRMGVPAPGIPYSLDAQGRPQYVQQPGSVIPSQNQWPGYTPIGYGPPIPPQPGFDKIQQEVMAQQFQQMQELHDQRQQELQRQQFELQMQQEQLRQEQYRQQLQYNQNPGYRHPGGFYSNTFADSGTPPVAPELSPTANPNLTNPNTAVQLVTPNQVNQAIQRGTQMVILDVRGELVRDVIGHIPNDIHVSLDPMETFPTRVRNAIPDQRFPIVVYCNDGINSARASNIMANMGYKVYLMGIYTGWAGHIPAQACTSCLYQ